MIAIEEYKDRGHAPEDEHKPRTGSELRLLPEISSVQDFRSQYITNRLPKNSDPKPDENASDHLAGKLFIPRYEKFYEEWIDVDEQIVQMHEDHLNQIQRSQEDIGRILNAVHTRQRQNSVTKNDDIRFLHKWHIAWWILWYWLSCGVVFLAYYWARTNVDVKPKENFFHLRNWIGFLGVAGGLFIVACVLLMIPRRFIERFSNFVRERVRMDPRQKLMNKRLRINLIQVWMLLPMMVFGMWQPDWVYPSIRWGYVFTVTILLTIAFGFDLNELHSWNIEKKIWDPVFDVCQITIFLVTAWVYKHQRIQDYLFRFYGSDLMITRADMIQSDDSNVTKTKQYPMEPLEWASKKTLLKLISDWCVLWATPISILCVVSYFGSLCFDNLLWENGASNTKLRFFLYNIVPLGGSDFVIGQGFVSGAILISAVHVWFVCYTTSVELNMIAIEAASGRWLTKSELISRVEDVRKRLQVLMSRMKYIIAVQLIFTFGILIVGFVQIASQHTIILGGDTALSLLFFAGVTIVTLAFAAHIFSSWNLLIDVITSQQKKFLCNEGANNTVDLSQVLDYFDRKPIGIQLFFGLNLDGKLFYAILISTATEAVFYLIKTFVAVVQS